MPIIAIGTPVTEQLIFNSGYLDFGSSRLVDIDNIVFEITFVEKELRRLNSIKMATHKRSTLKCGLKAKTKSINQEVLSQIMGTSTVDGSGHIISVTNGQATALNPVLTVYIDDDINKPYQFQFTDAIITSSPFTGSLEDFESIDIDLVARDVKVYAEVAGYDTMANKIFLEKFVRGTTSGLITLEAHS